MPGGYEGSIPTYVFPTINDEFGTPSIFGVQAKKLVVTGISEQQTK